MNRPAAHASVIGRCASWHCACRNPVALQGKSGPASGPTRESVILCPSCGRAYFVIPDDRSYGPPVEVVELFAVPEASAENHAGDSSTSDSGAASNAAASSQR